MAKTTQVQTAKTNNKAANNTPVNPELLNPAFAQYIKPLSEKQRKAMMRVHVERVSIAKQNRDKAANNTPVVEAETQPAAKAQTTRKGIFAIVAGTVVSIEHKALKKAIGYHVAKGNLKRLANGIGLTEQGAKDWNNNRVAHDPEQFQKIAAFVNGGANLPEFGGEKKTPVKVGGNKQLPSLEYWGSFTTMNMRLCFASLWASK